MQDTTLKSCKKHQNNAKSCKNLQDFNGADGRIRTGDLILTKDALYLLSYISAVRTSSNASVIILQSILKSNTLITKKQIRLNFLQFDLIFVRRSAIVHRSEDCARSALLNWHTTKWVRHE